MESLKQFLRHLQDFARREDALVTVEWVALTAAMVVAAVVISYTVMHNTNTEAKTIGNGITPQVGSTYGAGGSNL